MSNYFKIVRATCQCTDTISFWIQKTISEYTITHRWTIKAQEKIFNTVPTVILLKASSIIPYGRFLLKHPVCTKLNDSQKRILESDHVLLSHSRIWEPS